MRNRSHRDIPVINCVPYSPVVYLNNFIKELENDCVKFIQELLNRPITYKIYEAERDYVKDENPEGKYVLLFEITKDLDEYETIKKYEEILDFMFCQ